MLELTLMLAAARGLLISGSERPAVSARVEDGVLHYTADYAIAEHREELAAAILRALIQYENEVGARLTELKPIASCAS